MKRIAVFVYGLVAYALFLGVILYAIGFVGNFLVPKSLDSAPQSPLLQALLINVVLLGVFGLQHSVMARPAFKRWIGRWQPQAMERSTYVLMASLALVLVFWGWQPMGGIVWEVGDPLGRFLLYTLFAIGWSLVFVTTFLINHFDLFGLRQVWLCLRGREYTHLRFVTPGPYRLVRHPLYVGFLFAFWATPVMTATHLLFAVVTTAYVLVAIQLEERDLVDAHGVDYENYRARTGMLLPRLLRKSRRAAANV